MTKGKKMSINEWNDAGGVVCPECGGETLRLVDGVCLGCYNRKVAERERKLEDKRERRYYKDALKRGAISLRQMKAGRL